MKNYITTLLIAFLLHAHPAYASTPQIKPLWSIPFGETDSKADEIDGVSVDHNGNTIISGVFRGEIVMDGRTYKSKGAGDIFVASIDKTGKYNWKYVTGSVGDDNTYDLTTDAQGNIYMSGWFSNQINFGKTTLVSRGKTDMFVAKVSPSGDVIWAKSFGGPSNDGGNEISVSKKGEIAVSAMSDGDFSAGGKTYKYGGGARDAYFLRLNTQGDLKFAFPVNGKGTERIRALSMDEQGNIYLGFQFRGEVQLSNKHKVVGAGGWDGAMAKISNKGHVEWLYPVTSTGTDNVRGITVDKNGAVYVAGMHGKNALLVDRHVKSYGKKGTDYILKIAPNGKPEWIISAGGNGVAMGAEIVMSELNMPVITGFADGVVNFYKNFGDESIAKISNNTKGRTAYILVLDDKGNIKYSYVPEALDGGSSTSGGSISVSRNGRYIAQGLRFNKSMKVGDNIMTTKAEKDSALILFDLAN